MPFGIGPRICVGMRFALLEIKEVLVRTLKEFNITSCPSTPKEMTFDDEYFVRKPKNDIKVSFVKRLPY